MDDLIESDLLLERLELHRRSLNENENWAYKWSAENDITVSFSFSLFPSRSNSSLYWVYSLVGIGIPIC